MAQFINSQNLTGLDLSPREKAAIESALETALPGLCEMTKDAARPLDELFGIVIDAKGEVTCLVCETERQKDFIAALPDDDALRQEISDVTTVPANGLLRIVLVFERDGKCEFARVRIQIHDGGVS